MRTACIKKRGWFSRHWTGKQWLLSSWAVDSTAQVIVAALVTQEANDKQQLKPLVEKVQANCGRLPERVSADAGYCNTKRLTEVRRSGVDLYVSPDRQKYGRVIKTSAFATAAQAGGGVVGQMREKLKTAAGQVVYQWRKAMWSRCLDSSKRGAGLAALRFAGWRRSVRSGRSFA